MKNDKKIERKVAEIQSLCYEFKCTTKVLGNQDAFTNRIVEKILNKSKELKDLFDNQFEETTNKTNILSVPNFQHIDDVWKYLDNFHTKEELEKAFGEIPSKFGSFYIVNKETYKQDGQIIICNSYWDGNIAEQGEDLYSITVK